MIMLFEDMPTDIRFPVANYDPWWPLPYLRDITDTIILLRAISQRDELQIHIELYIKRSNSGQLLIRIVNYGFNTTEMRFTFEILWILIILSLIFSAIIIITSYIKYLVEYWRILWISYIYSETTANYLDCGWINCFDSDLKVSPLDAAAPDIVFRS